MRELNIKEVETVSGAGIFGTLGGYFGMAIGGIADLSTRIFDGHSPAMSLIKPISTFCTGIGLLIDSVTSLNLSTATDALTATGNGVALIIQAGIANKKATA